MVRPVKSRQIPNLPELIKETAWKQIAGSGASSLSLRSIARELQISAPAIYNYFPDRDALVTALIIDAFTSFGDYQLRAVERFPEADKQVERLYAAGWAYREWALAYPQRYVLVFGAPVPGYRFPESLVLPFMERSSSVLAGIIGELLVAGKLRIPEHLAASLGLDQAAVFMPQDAQQKGRLVSVIGMLIWSRVHGLVSLELAGMCSADACFASKLYAIELDLIYSQFVGIP